MLLTDSNSTFLNTNGNLFDIYIDNYKQLIKYSHKRRNSFQMCDSVFSDISKFNNTKSTDFSTNDNSLYASDCYNNSKLNHVVYRTVSLKLKLFEMIDYNNKNDQSSTLLNCYNDIINNDRSTTACETNNKLVELTTENIIANKNLVNTAIDGNNEQHVDVSNVLLQLTEVTRTNIFDIN